MLHAVVVIVWGNNLQNTLTMKKEIIKTKSVEFETLNLNGNLILKGGLSLVYNEMLLSAGKKAPVNTAWGCGCTVHNLVYGCGCS